MNLPMRTINRICCRASSSPSPTRRGGWGVRCNGRDLAHQRSHVFIRYEPETMTRMLNAPLDEREYEALVELLDALIDRVGEDETHPLASLMEVVGSLIERYEDEHVPELAETMADKHMLTTI